jgi:hypothetical protein
MVTEERCHVRSEPEEMPPPTIPVRNRDLVKYRALAVGYVAYCKAQGEEPKGTISFDAWAAAVELTLVYIRNWDRRRSALDEVL